MKYNNIIIEYTGLLNENQELQEVSILNYKTIPSSLEISMPESWQDNGIFSNYYKLAYNKLKTLSLNEKIGQLIGQFSLRCLSASVAEGFICR